MKTTIEQENWKDRFDEEQYDLLWECSETGNFKKWNIYRRKNRNKPILLEGAQFVSCKLPKIDLSKACCVKANFSSAELSKTRFMRADLRETRFDGATLNGAELITANLQNARLTSATLQDAKMRFINLTNADMHEAVLVNANLDRAVLENASLHGTDCSRATFTHANLKGTDLTNVTLNGSNFEAAIVDGETLIWDCHFDSEADFTGVGLTGARIEPQLLARFSTNIRRIWWKKWYAINHLQINSKWSHFIKSPFFRIINPLQCISLFFTVIIVKMFWWITDYGSKTSRLLKAFLGVSLFFAILYTVFPFLTNDEVLNSNSVYYHKFIRAFYFSIVTMATVGYGDISANPLGIAGHCICTMHVIIGYIILGALIVRLGILFQDLPEADATVQKHKAGLNLMTNKNNKNESGEKE